MTRPTGTITDFRLEQYRLGELPKDVAARITRLAETDTEIQARLAALAKSDTEIRDRYPDNWMARVDRPVRLSPRWLALAGACALVVAAAVWLPSPNGDGNRIKGDAASLLVYRRTESGSVLLADGDAARRGDLVRVAYRSASSRFGVIVSIDGRGVVTRHLPATGSTAVALQSGATILLDQAYELDDAPKWEHFVLITSESAFDVQTVLDAARDAVIRSGSGPPASLPLPKHFEQTSFLLRKVS